MFAISHPPPPGDIQLACPAVFLSDFNKIALKLKTRTKSRKLKRKWLVATVLIGEVSGGRGSGALLSTAGCLVSNGRETVLTGSQNSATRHKGPLSPVSQDGKFFQSEMGSLVHNQRSGLQLRHSSPPAQQ